MKVECPSCQTKYNLPDDKVGSDGANVRCSVCRHVFHVDAPQPEDFPGFGESGVDPVWPVSPEEPDAVDSFDSHLEKAQHKPDPYDGESLSSSDFSSIDFGEKKPKKSGGMSKKTLLLAIALGLVVAVGIAGTAAYFFEFWPFAKKPVPSAMENAPDKSAAPAAPAAPDYTNDIQFANHSHYFVENEKAGKIFVIEGTLVNKSPVIIGQVTLDAAILDSKGAVLVSKQFLAGPKATNFELKTLKKEDIETRLTSPQEVALYNSQVKPGEEVPFMVAFTDLPDTIKDFTLKVKNYYEVAPQGQAPAAGEKK